MTDVEGSYEGFLASRRSGRRNAIHEMETASAGDGATDLSQSLAQLSIIKPAVKEEDPESTQDSPSKEEESQGEGS